jgi:hypothetical protein
MAAVSQLPVDTPLSLVRGDDLTFSVRVELDLSGYTVEAGIYNSGLQAPETEIEPGLVVTPEDDPTPPETVHTMIAVTIDAVASADLDPRVPWRWYLRYVSPGGVVRTAFTGRVNVRLAPPPVPGS